MSITSAVRAPLYLFEQGAGLLNRIPHSALVLVARIATFSVFFCSGLVKLADWNATLMLFRQRVSRSADPRSLAAYMSASMELGLSTLVLVGLFTRLSALGLLGMVLVIQTFAYPMAWPDRIQWLAFMIFIVCWGPQDFARSSAGQVFQRGAEQ